MPSSAFSQDAFSWMDGWMDGWMDYTGLARQSNMFNYWDVLYIIRTPMGQQHSNTNRCLRHMEV